MSAGHRRRPRTEVDEARRVAFEALLAVEIDDAYLNLALGRLIDGANLEARDAAFTTELASGTARAQGTYDRIIGTCVKGGVAQLQAEVATGLRLGAHQLLAMRVPSHAAVGTSVELVRATAGERPVRLVNAVLRKIAARTYEEWIDDVAPAQDSDAVGWLAARHAHPRWAVEAFREALGPDGDLEGLLASDNDPPAVTLAERPGLCETSELTAAGLEPGRWSPYAATLAGGRPADVPAVRDGRAGVQDEGSQLVALALASAPLEGRDEFWLDLAAGPGGKAALLTGLARRAGATLVSAERLHHRSRLVADSLRAYPSRQAPAIVTTDGTRPPYASGTFDRVLLDAPCSGLGALRRRPEARWRKRPADLKELVPLQRGLLTSALDLVRPGGVVAYATCSPHIAETRGVVESVLADHPGVTVLDAAAELGALGVPGLEGPYAQLWPHVHGTDAMFCVLLQRG